MTKSKLKELLNELKKLKVQTVLVYDYKRRKRSQNLHSRTKLIVSDSDIDEAFKSMHQSIMTKMKNYTYEDWISLSVITKHSIERFEIIKWRS